MASIDKIDEQGAVVGKRELAAALVQDKVNTGLSALCGDRRAGRTSPGYGVCKDAQ